MSSAVIKSFAQEYFTSLNPIARRISLDIAATREAYEDIWHGLSGEEQNQVVDETIIDPKAILKYAFYPKEDPEVEYFPRLRFQTGEKYVVDEERGLTWRDEHSAPFSWRTQSQLDISIFGSASEGKPKSCVEGFQSPQPVHTKPKSTPKRKSHQSADTFDPPSVVLGGSTMKVTSNLSAKVRFPPKTEIAKFASAEDSLLAKLKNKTAILKIPLKTFANKSSGSEPSKTDEMHQDTESLVQPTQPHKLKPKPVISKPKTPPPPPPKPAPKPSLKPALKPSLKPAPKPPLKQAPKPPPKPVPKPPALESKENAKVVVATHSDRESERKHSSCTGRDPEKAALLADCTEDEAVTEKQEGIIQSQSSDVLRDFKIDLSNPSDNIPKTGFEFLDNW